MMNIVSSILLTTSEYGINQEGEILTPASGKETTCPSIWYETCYPKVSEMLFPYVSLECKGRESRLVIALPDPSQHG